MVRGAARGAPASGARPDPRPPPPRPPRCDPPPPRLLESCHRPAPRVRGDRFVDGEPLRRKGRVHRPVDPLQRAVRHPVRAEGEQDAPPQEVAGRVGAREPLPPPPPPAPPPP